MTEIRPGGGEEEFGAWWGVTGAGQRRKETRKSKREFKKILACTNFGSPSSPPPPHPFLNHQPTVAFSSFKLTFYLSVTSFFFFLSRTFFPSFFSTPPSPPRSPSRLGGALRAGSSFTSYSVIQSACINRPISTLLRFAAATTRVRVFACACVCELWGIHFTHKF